MRSPARAVAWDFRHRHRWGLAALIVYLVVLATVKLVVVATGRLITLDSPESFAFVVVVPVTATFTYFLAVFTFGLEGDLAARQSMYPPRLFTRPVTTASLAGLPMLYGSLAMASLWAATRLFALWPAGFVIPTLWPAVLAASLLAWTQALVWMPYPLPGLRIVVAVLWLAIIDAIVLVALQYHAREGVMLAIVAPQIPLAYFSARIGVARARRGDIPDWSGAFTRLGKLTYGASRRRHFASPTQAQTWFEWRQHGRSLPVWIAILLPLELALLGVTGHTTALVFTILAGVLVTPPVMAIFTATSVRGPTGQTRDGYGLSPFLATRPVSTTALLGAKLRATVRTTFVTWVLVLLAIPLALKLSHTWPVVVDQLRDRADGIGTLRTAALVVMIVGGAMLWTWKQLVQSLYIGMSGRERLVKGSVFVTLSLLFLIGPVIELIAESTRVQRLLWDGLPLMLAVLVLLKMSAACWTVTRLHRQRLVTDESLLTGAVCWCAAVLGVYGVLAWFLATPFFPHYVLLLLAILAIPLARLSAAPIALDANRHR